MTENFHREGSRRDLFNNNTKNEIIKITKNKISPTDMMP
jgi:hypothetical protein